jgi:hypothetical protein
MSPIKILNVVLLLVLSLSCKKDEPAPVPEPKPEINCGMDWYMYCINQNWVTEKHSPKANLQIHGIDKDGFTALLMYNPHDSMEPNPPWI